MSNNNDPSFEQLQKLLEENEPAPKKPEDEKCGTPSKQKETKLIPRTQSKQPAIWFAVDENGIEEWYDQKPKRTESCWWCDDFHSEGVLFPGAIQAITGRTLTWADEPLEWKPEEIKDTRKIRKQ